MHITGHFCAIERGTLHAAKARYGKSRRKTYDTACGRRALAMAFPVLNQPDTTMTVHWPPYVDQAREWGYERCRDCMTAAPGKPERVKLVTTEKGDS